MLPETSRMDSTTLSLSNMTSSRRRETLWNVLEPGDPYDIRKYSIDKADP